MVNFKEIFTFTPDFIIKIKRITDIDFSKSSKLIAIQNSAYFYFGQKISNDPLILPKFYAALAYLTGPSDRRYDHFKGSYSFIFELEVQKNGKASKYCYHIYHYRSYIEFSVYQIVSKVDPREKGLYYQPDKALFSDKDIYDFSEAFYRYVLKRIQLINYMPEPFLKYSDSNLLLFGYFKNKYFFKDYEDEDLYFQEKEFSQEKIDVELRLSR